MYKLLQWVSELQAIAQNGLAYAHNEFDKERYSQLMKIASAMASHVFEIPIEKVDFAFIHEQGYATPKLDVRSFIIKDEQVLLVKERSDGLWTLPGGWIDINESPAESVVRETKEETGYGVEPIKLLALWDKLKHHHPPHWPHTYKCFFHCKIIGGQPEVNVEISAIKFFPLSHLPELSTARVTEQQMHKLYTLILESKPTSYD